MRRLRGMAGAAVIWASGWGVVGGVLAAIDVVLASGPPVSQRLAALPAVTLGVSTVSAILGAAAGVAFSAIVMLRGGSGRLRLNANVGARWGAAGGGILAMVGAALNASGGGAAFLSSLLSLAVLPVVGAAAGVKRHLILPTSDI